MAESRAFALSAELRGHEQDVRCVAASSRGEVLTASRDASLRIWTRGEDTAAYSCAKTLLGHSHFVGAVAVVPGTSVVVSGSNDKHVIVWDEATGVPSRILEGHTDVVSCVAVSDEGDIISGSWDKTVRVWRAVNAEAVDVLTGHTQVVWAVLPFPHDGGLASASGDRTIRLWRAGKCSATLTGHTDVVRGLALVPSLGFASASNDGSLRLWSLDGSALLSIVASGTFLYSVTSLPGLGDLAVCGEDRTLRVYRDGELLQAIAHPAPVWSVAALPNGDLVTGCADAVARVFSREESRRAPGEALALFDAEVQAQAIPATEIPGQVGGVDVANLPDESVLATELGTKEGQYKIVRDASGSPCLYTWSVAEGQWNKIGTVVGDPNAAGSGGGGGGAAGGPSLGRKEYRGQLYDFVFDVDITEGQPPLQLPYNRDQDPYMVAQQFIWDHNLPQGYLEQTANFIVTNAGPSTGPVAARNVDPLTANGAYVPPPLGAGGGTQRAGGGAVVANVDPLTAAGAYRPTYAPVQQHATYEDPLSANRYRPGGAAAAAAGAAGGAAGGAGGAAGSALFPAREAVKFDTMAKPEVVLAKLASINAELEGAAAAAAGEALSAEELRSLSAMGTALATAAGGPARAPADALSPIALGALEKAVRWPAGQAFPALDVLRLSLLHAAGAARCAAFKPPLVPALLAFLSAPAAAPPPTVVMALRCLCNMCAVSSLHGLIGESVTAVLEAASEHLNGAQNAQARTAAATLLLNFSVFISQSPASEEEGQAQILSAIAPALAALAEGPPNEDLTLRLLVTVGTLALSKQGATFVRRLAADLGVGEAVGKLAQAESERVRTCAAQLGPLLAAST